MYGHHLNDERLYKSTLQRVRSESVFLELYHTLTRKCKCAGISVIISLSRATTGTVGFFFFTVKLDPINSFPSNTLRARHIYLKLTVVFSWNFKDNFVTGMQMQTRTTGVTTNTSSCTYIFHKELMGHIMREPVFVICEQQRHRTASASMQSD